MTAANQSFSHLTYFFVIQTLKIQNQNNNQLTICNQVISPQIKVGDMFVILHI